MNSWIIRCAPGLGKVAVSEIKFRKLLGRNEQPLILRQRNHDLIFFHANIDVKETKLLRIPEEIHRCLLFGRFKISNSQIERLSKQLISEKKSFRISVTADGSHFARQDMQRFLSNKLAESGVDIDENAEDSIWMFCIDESYYLTLRVASFPDAPFRAERISERSGALPVTIAAAIAFLGEPKAKDTVLDFVCGSGTLLAECYAYEPKSSYTGIDIDPDAISAAKQNLAHIPEIKLFNVDSRNIDLQNHSISLFLANLPFGKQYGDKKSNAALYSQIFAEMKRVGKSKLRAVILTSDNESLQLALKSHSDLKCKNQIKIKTRGEWAWISLIS